MEKHDNLYMKIQNKKWVLELIKKNAPISRADIAKRTNMSPTSISRIVNELETEGYVVETNHHSSGVGRKATFLNVSKDAIFTIGIDLTEQEIKIGIITFTDEVLAAKTIPNTYQTDSSMTLQAISIEVKQILKEHEIMIEKVIGIGIGMPGYIDFEKGIVTLSSQLGWRNVHVSQELEQLIGVRVLVDNDLRMKAMAEYLYGSAKSSSSSVLIGISSGVGSAIIMNGDYYRGQNNLSGEISHTVVDINGELCSCGKYGCLVSIVSEEAILRQARKVTNIKTLDEIQEAFKHGETWAINLLDRVTTYIAITVSNIFYLYNPAILVLSGKVLEKYDVIQTLVEEKYSKFIAEPYKTQSKLSYATMGENSIILGAAIQARSAFLEFN